MRIGLVVPHIFMQQAILPSVIFSPGELALNLAEGLSQQAEVTLFTPGPVKTTVPNITADLSYFEAELATRGDDYLSLLKKHPLTFITLSRQIQSELLAKAFAMANSNQLDLLHIYTNEEDNGLAFAQFCQKPVVFTHHDPFNFLANYRSVFPKYAHLNWLSMSLAQRQTMPKSTNWLANIYHGLPVDQFTPSCQPTGGYVAYMGRIIKPKGVHLAIAAIKRYNADHPNQPLRLKIAGKHYSGQKDHYWQEIQPLIDGQAVEYVGFIKDTAAKQAFLSQATGLIIPSTFAEPFGMVMIEALACGTPIIGLRSGAIPEVIELGRSGWLVDHSQADTMVANLAQAVAKLPQLDRYNCRQAFEQRFSLDQMCQAHLAAYQSLLTN